MHAWHRKWSRSLISRLFFSQAPAWRNLSIALFRICTGRFPQLNFVSWIFPQYLHDLNIWFSSGLSALVECPRWMAAALVYCRTPCKNIDPWFHSQVYKNKGRNYEKYTGCITSNTECPDSNRRYAFQTNVPLTIIPLQRRQTICHHRIYGVCFRHFWINGCRYRLAFLRLPYRRGTHG